MSRLFRHTLTFVAAMLCTGVCVLWARSYRHTDVVAFFGRASHLQAAGSHGGMLIVFLSDVPFAPEQRFSFKTASVAAEQAGSLDELLFDKSATKVSVGGFRLATGRIVFFAAPPGYLAVAVPHWFAAILTGTPAALGLRRLVRRRRWVRLGRCGRCGYDLRSSPGRCPECGDGSRIPIPQV